MSFLDTLGQWRDAIADVELDQIDWENPGSWPLAVKIFLLVVAFLFTLGIGYSLITKSQLDDLGVQPHQVVHNVAAHDQEQPRHEHVRPVPRHRADRPETAGTVNVSDAQC